MANQCANFHCDNITFGSRIRCGVCRRPGGGKPKCIGCDADVPSERAFMCKPCKHFKDNEKVKLWHKRYGQARKIVLRLVIP